MSDRLVQAEAGVGHRSVLFHQTKGIRSKTGEAQEGSVQSQLPEGGGEEALASARRTENLAGLGGGTSEARESARRSPTLSVSPEGLTVSPARL